MAYDSAFFDRMHYYIPGWEIPKYRPEFFTHEYGFIKGYGIEHSLLFWEETLSNICDFRINSVDVCNKNKSNGSYCQYNV